MGMIILKKMSAMMKLDESTSIPTHAWNSARSVLDFLGHVDSTVDSLPSTDQQETPTNTFFRATNDKSSRSSHLAHNTSASHRRPTSKVLELAEYIANRSSRSKNPERDNDDEEADDEHDEDDNIEDRQVFGREDVEGDGEGSHGHGHQCSLPVREW
jgi:hypothetical protein